MEEIQAFWLTLKSIRSAVTCTIAEVRAGLDLTLRPFIRHLFAGDCGGAKV